MDIGQREVLKEQLKAMIAGRGDGICLDSADRCSITGVRDSVAFFQNLPLLIPEDSVLCFEGIDVVPAMAVFCEAHRAGDGAVCVARETVYPIPEMFHVQLGLDAIKELAELLGRNAQQRCFLHVKAYRQARLLLHFHDAFDGSDLLASGDIPAERVQLFCDSLGVTHRREPNESKSGTEALSALLRAMENPEKVRILWPWWKRALLFWKR